MPKRKRILLVEDDTELRRLYALGLNNQGFEVKLAANGADAVERLDETTPDVILLDLMLPVMTGWEVLDRFTAPSSTHPPIIVISGQQEPPEPDGRVATWLAKPVTIEQIVAAVEAALAKSG